MADVSGGRIVWKLDVDDKAFNAKMGKVPSTVKASSNQTNAAFSSIATSGSRALSGLADVSGKVSASIGRSFSTMGAGMTRIFEGVGTAGSRVFSALPQPAQGALRTIGNAFASAGSVVASGLRSIGSVGSSVFSGLGNAVSGAASRFSSGSGSVSGFNESVKQVAPAAQAASLGFGKMTGAVALGMAAFTMFSGSITSVINTIKSVVSTGLNLLVTGFRSLITYGFQSTMSIQNSVAALKSLSTSSKEAGDTMQWVINFVKGKPFDRMDVLGAAKQLMAYGRSAQDLRGDIDLLGKAVVISGKDWSNLSAVYGRVSSQNRLMNDDFRILTDAGINLGGALQTLTGKSMAELVDAMANGEITFATFRKALEMALPASAVEESSNTISNKLISLKSAFRDLAFELLGVDFSRIDQEGMPLVKPGGVLDLAMKGVDALTESLRAGDLKGLFGLMGDGIAFSAGKIGDWIQKQGGLDAVIKSFVTKTLPSIISGVADFTRILGGVLAVVTFAAGAILRVFASMAYGPLLVLEALGKVPKGTAQSMLDTSNALMDAAPVINEKLGGLADLMDKGAARLRLGFGAEVSGIPLDTTAALAPLTGNIVAQLEPGRVEATRIGEATKTGYIGQIALMPGLVFDHLKLIAGKVTEALQPAQTVAYFQGAAMAHEIQNGLNSVQLTAPSVSFQGSTVTIQGRAKGGTVYAGQPYIVGEKGPELFVPHVGGEIIPEVPSMGGMVRGSDSNDEVGGAGVTNNFYPKILTESDIDMASNRAAYQQGMALR